MCNHFPTPGTCCHTLFIQCPEQDITGLHTAILAFCSYPPCVHLCRLFVQCPEQDITDALQWTVHYSSCLLFIPVLHVLVMTVCLALGARHHRHTISDCTQLCLPLAHTNTLCACGDSLLSVLRKTSQTYHN